MALIISRKKLARAKLEKLKRGYSAFAETEEVAELIEKELDGLDLQVHIDRTSVGTWFIPKGRDMITPSQCPPDSMEEPLQ
ncbi:hypothetical protein GCM10011571_18710 [Marinithermofilum abyssi]|uniref:Uncharacterized protein n=1 Tax=Marinithermofilum abyssi TaxID=1571185 RepID=A0A8J2VBZ4_9BACL|nr:hypothetical protein [Marinithermofilum abyssi]GGE17293.1 hypothetical protein GCM10011571_18710 [Marinithermofilum abyssi]